jgi:hypothetical protein
MSAGTRSEEIDAPWFPAPDDAPAEDVLPFEVWSETSARLTRMDAERREQILAAREVPPSRWESSDMHWSRVLAAEVGEGRMDRATSHGLRCAEEMNRRKERGGSASKSEPTAAELADGTAEMSALRDEPALPFDAGRSAGLGAGRGSAFAASLPRSFQAPKLRRPLEGETMEVPALREPAESALPFLDPARALDGWTTTQYASLCAELSVFKENSREVLARYHLEDDAARRRLDENWKRRAANDPRLGHEIQRLYAAYRAYLVKA